MSADPLRVGWLGVGRMGQAMVGRLLDAGVGVSVWNRTPQRAAALVARGAHQVDQIAALRDCDVVFVTVSTSADAEAVLTGPDGLLGGDDAGPLAVVNSSTVSQETSAALRAQALARGVAFVASPVSGNADVVAAGKGCLVASGPPGTFALVAPLLHHIAGTVVYAGEGERALLVKLASNLYLGILAAALVETTSLAEKGGVARRDYLDFLNGTVLGSEWVRHRADHLVDLDWTPTFTSVLLRKDFDLGMAVARASEVPLPLAALTGQMLQASIGAGHAEDDFLALYEVQARAAGIDARPERPAPPDAPPDA